MQVVRLLNLNKFKPEEYYFFVGIRSRVCNELRCFVYSQHKRIWCPYILLIIDVKNRLSALFPLWQLVKLILLSDIFDAINWPLQLYLRYSSRLSRIFGTHWRKPPILILCGEQKGVWRTLKETSEFLQRKAPPSN